MRKKLIILVSLILAIAGSGFNFFYKPRPTPTLKIAAKNYTESNSNVLMDKECKRILKKVIEGMKINHLYDEDVKYDSFYSSRCDTCMMTSINLLDYIFTIYDIKGNYINFNYNHAPMLNLIFQINSKCITSLDLTAVDKIRISRGSNFYEADVTNLYLRPDKCKANRKRSESLNIFEEKIQELKNGLKK